MSDPPKPGDKALERLRRFLEQKESDVAFTFVEPDGGEGGADEDASDLVARLKTSLTEALSRPQAPSNVREMKMAARTAAASDADVGLELTIDQAVVRIVEDEETVLHVYGRIPADVTHLIVGDEEHPLERVTADHLVIRSLNPISFEEFLELHLASAVRYPLRWNRR